MVTSHPSTIVKQFLNMFIHATEYEVSNSYEPLRDNFFFHLNFPCSTHTLRGSIKHIIKNKQAGTMSGKKLLKYVFF